MAFDSGKRNGTMSDEPKPVVGSREMKDAPDVTGESSPKERAFVFGKTIRVGATNGGALWVKLPAIAGTKAVTGFSDFHFHVGARDKHDNRSSLKIQDFQAEIVQSQFRPDGLYINYKLQLRDDDPTYFSGSAQLFFIVS
jgi:hypothetical protein